MAISPSSLAIQIDTLVNGPPTATPASTRVVNQQVRSAVATLNQSQAAGTGREFSISIDAKTKLSVVRIVDSSTRELIDQIPSQSVLDLAQELGPQSHSTSRDPVR